MDSHGEMSRESNSAAVGRAASTQVENSSTQPRIMAVLANYGTGNDVYLHKVLDSFRSMPFQFDLHILTNVPKDLGPKVKVHVGLPTSNPLSLPFAHRRLFAENLIGADYFIYCEDDVLITERSINAFLELSRVLKPDEIPGFLRVEYNAAGERYMESAHGAFRWEPASLVKRGDFVLASFTNFHSAFTMASRAQVQQAINSGGFIVPPHIGRFDIRESASSDLYTQCGLKRLICISGIEDFLVRHLSDKNCCKWGIPYKEFLENTRALQRIDQEGGWKGSLVEVETRMPRGFWAKNLYESPDPQILDKMPKDAKTVLAVGSGWGATEELLAKQGKHVVALPVDGVFGDCLRRRGIEVVEGPLEKAVATLRNRQFDAILMLDFIHLLPEPTNWLTLIRPLLGTTGVLLATVPRTFDPLRLAWYLRGEPAAVSPKSYARTGVQKVTHARLAKWFDAAGLNADIQVSCNTPARMSMLAKVQGLGGRLFGDRFLVRATSRANV
jgi:hypothetical protein